jgi:hypothetical protein
MHCLPWPCSGCVLSDGFTPLQVAYLDYVRFLIGRMWGSVSPESCKSLTTALNHGTHKRYAPPLFSVKPPCSYTTQSVVIAVLCALV